MLRILYNRQDYNDTAKGFPVRVPCREVLELFASLNLDTKRMKSTKVKNLIGYKNLVR